MFRNGTSAHNAFNAFNAFNEINEFSAFSEINEFSAFSEISAFSAFNEISALQFRAGVVVVGQFFEIGNEGRRSTRCRYASVFTLFRRDEMARQGPMSKVGERRAGRGSEGA